MKKKLLIAMVVLLGQSVLTTLMVRELGLLASGYGARIFIDAFTYTVLFILLLTPKMQCKLPAIIIKGVGLSLGSFILNACMTEFLYFGMKYFLDLPGEQGGEILLLIGYEMIHGTLRIALIIGAAEIFARVALKDTFLPSLFAVKSIAIFAGFALLKSVLMGLDYWRMQSMMAQMFEADAGNLFALYEMFSGSQTLLAKSASGSEILFPYITLLLIAYLTTKPVPARSQEFSR